MTTKLKFPKTLGETIDLLYSARAARLELEKQVTVLKDREAAVKNHLMSNFDKAGLEGAKGKVATASIKYTTTATVTDWSALWTYIHKTKSEELIQKRVSITALRELWDNNKVVPGVESGTVMDISLTKVSK